MSNLGFFLWAFAEKSAVQVMQFVIGILLARLLEPSDFGLFAILTIIISFSNAFVNSGFGQALIQKKEISYKEETAVFTFNIVVAFVLNISFFFLAPKISDFYNYPELVSMIRLISLGVLLNAVALVPRSKIAKNLEFNLTFKANTVGVFSGAGISVFFAYHDYAYKALVFGFLAKEVVTTIMFYCIMKWRPMLNFDFRSIKDLFRFGGRLLFVSVSNAIFFNIQSLVIARMYSSEILGLYSRGDTLSKFPVNFYNSVISQFTFPLFSKLQGNKEQLKVYLRASFTITSLVLFPFLSFLCLAADDLVLSLLTIKWINAIPYVRVLVFAGFFTPLVALNLNVINSLGRSDQSLKADIIGKMMILIGVFISYKFGALIMAFSFSIAMMMGMLVYMYYLSLNLDVSIFRQLSWVTSGFVASMIPLPFLLLLRGYFGDTQSFELRLAFSLVIWMLLYLVTLRVMFWRKLLQSIRVFDER